MGKPAVGEWFVKRRKVAPPKTVTPEPPAFTVEEMVPSSTGQTSRRTVLYMR